MNCQNPKTKIDKIIAFLKYLLRYLDNNKTEAVIIFTGLSVSIIASALSEKEIQLIIDSIFR